MEHSMFLTQVIGCIVAALVVAVLWLFSRLRAVERGIDLDSAAERALADAARARREAEMAWSDAKIAANQYRLAAEREEER